MNDTFIFICARRWYDQRWGNTYHSVTVHVNGRHIGTSPFEYGYGDAWKQTATAILRGAGFDVQPHEALWAYKERTGHQVTTDVVDVTRRRDLHYEGR